MTIEINYYIDIASGVAAGVNIGTRQLNPCLFIDDPLIPSGSFVDFTNNQDSAANVEAYFGSSSEEYARAQMMFAWISKLITQVPSMRFARWNSAACAPVVYGDPHATQTALGSWTSITTGSFILTMGTYTYTLSGLDFSSALSLADVAGVIQSAIQAETGGGSLWTGATCTYNSTAGRFIITGGATGVAAISVAAGSGGNDIAAALGFLSVNTILGPGAGVQTPSQALQALDILDNNFGSFCFASTADLSNTDIEALATTNEGLDNDYLYSIGTVASNVSTLQALISGIGGCTTTLIATSNVDFDEQMPMAILGATDYSRGNATQNYMFQQFPGATPKVTDTTTAEAYDALKVNYYANTQESGQIVDLYQRGAMNGGSSQPASQNTYANEIWLKASLTAALMNLLMNSTKISANAAGRAAVINCLQAVITQALANGTISVGRTLNSSQIAVINNIANDPNAYRAVQSLGYWLNAVVTTKVVNSITRYVVNYTLIYAQDQVITEIDGSDILI